MGRINQRGFGILHLLMVVVLVGAIGAVGYFVYSSQNIKEVPKTSITNFDECVAAGNPVMESYPEQCSADGQTFVNEKQRAVLSLDNSKLPQGWNLANEAPDLITLDNSAIDLEPSESCSVEVQYVTDDSVKKTDEKVVKERLRLEYAQQIQGDKGYETEALPDVVVTVQLGSEQASISSFYDLITLPASEYGMYQKKAYIVEDGAYISVLQSCHGTDFSESAEALLAITIRL